MSQEMKISLEDLEELLAEDNTASGGRRFRLNFQTIFSALVLNWHWFLLSLIICVCGALIYLRFAEPVYQVSARMLVKNNDSKKKSASQMLSDVEDLGYLSNSSGIENEVEVLRSRLLLRDVVKDLKLYTEYRREDGFKDVIVYKNQPFCIDLDPEHLDSLDIAYLESSQWLKMEVWREGTNYMISGTLKAGAGDPVPFEHRAKSLPDTIKTRLGTLTMTAVPSKKLEEGQVYIVTISPPMQVATSYLSRLTIKPTTKRTDIALLTLKDNNYRRGVDVLRQLSICYNRQANAEKNEVAMRTEEFINDRMAKIDKELGSTEEEIQQFKQQNAVTSLSDASQSVQMSNEFSARLSEANSQVQMLDYMREYVNNPGNKYQIIPSNVGVSDGATTSLINNYNQAVQDRNRLLMSASEEAPQVKTLTATIDELQRSIQTALLQARSSADIRRQGIQSQFAKFQGRVSAAPIQERVLNKVGRQQDVKSTLYMLLLQKREENSIALAATADNGKLVDEPLNEGKVSPKNLIIILVAVLLGLLIPALCLWIISLFRYKIEGHEDLARLTDLPIIADVAVASENVKDKAGIVVQANKNNQIDEIFRSMRTNIQFMLQGDQKVILFTSSISNEGKTFNAANLAVSFALLGKKVILCGLDIRRPALGRLFDIPEQSKGITPLLTLDEVSQAALNAQILNSGVNANLDLLLAGPVPPNPTELLARDNFHQIVDMLRAQYDYVIFDTAPVGIVTDTLQIGQPADITVFVCRADYTHKSAVGLLNTLAKEQKLPNPCVILNGIDMSRRKNGYYYGYGRYGKYGRYGYGSYGKYSYGNYGNYGNYGQYAESHYGNKDDDSIKK
ncbi:MAG: polysaccharide biosynthesis tyrosine autokinase [Bacteroidaceae bacterium]|nr:polysaccharide biosynthesis tyrosine autokinase [Bacteroidaceae bacterium]